MKRRISAAMMVSGTMLLLISVLFSTVSFAAPDLGRQTGSTTAAVLADEPPPGEDVTVAAEKCPPENCDDGNACTVDDQSEGEWHAGECQYGECIGTARDCDDADPCTIDGCDPASGCTHEPDPGCSTVECTTHDDCDDGDSCTDDSCVDGVCQHDPVPPVCNAQSPAAAAKCVGEPVGTIVQLNDKTCKRCRQEPGQSGCSVSCDVGGPSVECPGCVPDIEVCNGLDDDCDGEVDEGGVCDACTDDDTRTCDTGLQGVCADGTETCVGGQWSGTCIQDTASSEEICNGLDDDCDGTVDEGLGTTTCGVGECQVTVDYCVGGVVQDCVPGEPGEEVCDGLDNDCDGQVDEDLGTTTCGVGVCQVTIDNCIDGVPQECVPGEPSDEVCGDGLDNNCNGEIDEGCACTPDDTQDCYPGPAGTEGVGLCQAGSQTCDENGQWGECVGAIVPTDEICDLLDNDCDGGVDEGLGTTTCGVGECEVTIDNCLDGELQECVPGEPTDEICDGKDNDCDGNVDEGGVCGTPPPREGPEPEPEAAPTPTPTPVVEVLGVESLPTAGVMPVGPALPILPMIFSSLALIGGGLLLWGEEDE